MNKKTYKSGYFWGLFLGIIFIMFNVTALPIISKYSESQIHKIDFSMYYVLCYSLWFGHSYSKNKLITIKNKS